MQGRQCLDESFQRLPPILVFVQFLIALNERDTTHELLLLDALVKRVAENSPKALSSLGWLHGESPLISNNKRDAFKACFTPETNPVWIGRREWP